MTESPAVTFERLGAASPPRQAEMLLGTACVLGGSIAGLFAARVLADHAERVVVIERDPAVNPAANPVAGAAGPRAGVPQGQHIHVLVPRGHEWIERWFPGLTREIVDRGAVFSGPEQGAGYQDGRARSAAAPSGLLASRTLLEDTIRGRVMGLPNVSTVRARATGLAYRGDEVCGARVETDDVVEVLPADLVVDAMGRASRLSDWLSADGFDRPVARRLPVGLNYATALFKRAQRPEELPLTRSVARYAPPHAPDGVTAAVVMAIENDQWMVTLGGYDDVRPGRTPDAFRATCAKLPPLFADATANDLTGPIAVYHQAESMRRDFAGLGHFPGRLVSVGDAVASFNPIYGQGMTSAALHASCLSEYLSTGSGLHAPATRFFGLQQVVTDAAWTISAGADAARLDARSGAEVPAEVSRQRRAMDQILRATAVDAEVCHAVDNVIYMITHPSALADPALLEQAIAANQRES